MVDEAKAVPGYEAVGVRWLSVGVVDDGIEDESPNAEGSMTSVTRLPEVHTLNWFSTFAEPNPTGELAPSRSAISGSVTTEARLPGCPKSTR